MKFRDDDKDNDDEDNDLTLQLTEQDWDFQVSGKSYGWISQLNQQQLSITATHETLGITVNNIYDLVG